MSYRIKATPDRKYVRALLARLPDGIQIGMIEQTFDDPRTPPRSLGKHPGVLTADGELLRSANGIPVKVAGTPGSQNSLAADVASIRKALRETA